MQILAISGVNLSSESETVQTLRFVDFPLNTNSETVMRVRELDATIEMMLYTDHTYSKAYSSAPTIELRDKVGKHSGGRSN